jgi:Ca2+-binding EF-hand superfamily protein
MAAPEVVVRSHWQALRPTKIDDEDMTDDEVRDVLRALGYDEESDDDKFVGLLFMAMDTDGNGGVSYTEFKQVFCDMTKTGYGEAIFGLVNTIKAYPEDVKWAIGYFKYCDSNSSGYMSHGAFNWMCKQLLDNDKSSPPDYDLKEADENDDGKISFLEFMQWAWRNYDKMKNYEGEDPTDRWTKARKKLPVIKWVTRTKNTAQANSKQAANSKQGGC